MSSQLQVRSIYKLTGIGIVVTGEVRHSDINDNMMGMTSDGKRCVIVKIEVSNEVVRKAHINEMATIVFKNITMDDIKPGAIIYFD